MGTYIQRERERERERASRIHALPYHALPYDGLPCHGLPDPWSPVSWSPGSIVYCIIVSCVIDYRITFYCIMISRMRGGFITRPQVKSNELMCHRWQLATMNLDLYNFISSCNFCVYAANHAAFLPALYPSGCRRMKNIWITVFIVFLTTLLSMSSNLQFWRSDLTTHLQVKSIAI